MNKVLLLSIVLILATRCFAQENILDMKFTPSKTKGTIKLFLKEMEVQLKASFLYDNSKIPVDKIVTLKKEEKTVRTILNKILEGEQVKVIQRGKNIILKKETKKESKRVRGKATIKGYIKEAGTGENLIGAHAFHIESLSGTSSNYYGFYSITLPIGQTTMSYSYVGFQNIKQSFNLQRDTVINVSLSSELLDEVVVSANKSIPIQETTEMGTINISSQQIKARPTLGGEVDIIKVLQLMPGVQSGREGSAGLYVRGGGPDQNLILLDGVPVYNVSHLFGFMSVFNADAINNVKLTKGAFPARYGGRLSSVVDISMKEGNTNEIKGEGSIGLVSAKITVEGPIQKGKTSFIVSARRTYLDILARPFIKTEKTNPNFNDRVEKSDGGYYFYDFNAKINHQISEKDRLYISAYTGRDSGFGTTATIDKASSNINDMVRNTTETQNDLEWGSSIGLLRWNHVFGSKIFSNVSLSYSKYDFFSENEFYEELQNNNGTFTDFQNFRVSSGIEDWAVGLDFDFYPNPNHYVRFGAKTIAHNFTPNIVGIREEEKKDTTFNANSIKTKEFAFYIEDDVKINQKLKANIGVHISGFSVNGKFFNSFQPRVSFRYLLGENIALKGSYTKMTQFLHLLTNPGIGLPTDFWVPATDRVKPQESDQFVIGLAYTHPTKDFEVSIESYYKSMDNLIEYKEGAGFLNLNENWQDKIETGKGRGYGIEFFISKSFAKTDGWIGYTLSWSDRTFENLNFGKTFPFKYDRRHDISAVINHKLSDKILLSANWVFGTGTALTLPIGEYRGSTGHFNERYFSNFYEDYDGRNSFRMRSYHRADVSASFHKKKKWGQREWVISIYNIYSRRNPFYIEQRVVENFDQVRRPKKFREFTLFPIIPSISYRFKF